jgi:hypothetical protein
MSFVSVASLPEEDVIRVCCGLCSRARTPLFAAVVRVSGFVFPFRLLSVPSYSQGSCPAAECGHPSITADG